MLIQVHRRKCHGNPFPQVTFDLRACGVGRSWCSLLRLHNSTSPPWLDQHQPHSLFLAPNTGLSGIHSSLGEPDELTSLPNK